MVLAVPVLSGRVRFRRRGRFSSRHRDLHGNDYAAVLALAAEYADNRSRQLFFAGIAVSAQSADRLPPDRGRRSPRDRLGPERLRAVTPSRRLCGTENIICPTLCGPP